MCEACKLSIMGFCFFLLLWEVGIWSGKAVGRNDEPDSSAAHKFFVSCCPSVGVTTITVVLLLRLG